MHELSVAQSLVDLVSDQIDAFQPSRVSAVRVRIGTLSGIAPAALQSAWRSAIVGTPLKESTLHIEMVDLVVYCPQCREERLLDGVQGLRCPVCETRTSNILQGRELELSAIEVLDEAPILEVRQTILKKNDEQARALRKRFEQAGVFVVSLVSSPGAGKTTLLRQTLIDLSARHRAAALVGDLATENDAKRLAESGAPVRQIITGTVCHLEAEMVENALLGWDLESLDLLFIENVGNLVCPASYDLGENIRTVLFSTTEGEDKPLKYPTIFNTADLAILTKSDLADVVGFDRTKARSSIQDVRPGMQTIELSAKTGQGMNVWTAWLDDCVMQGKRVEFHHAG